MLHPEGGSFKDPAGRVYRISGKTRAGRIVRGLHHAAAPVMEQLLAAPFYQELATQGHVVRTALLDAGDADARCVLAEGWSAAAEHQAVDFLTWPYEWPFSMLQDAALLQLHLLDTSVRHGWILKDATPFNIQWQGTRPVFIDIPSFVPWENGAYWQGYRQFCATFLTPLLLTAHLDIPFQPLLRSWPEGIPPEEAAKWFYGLQRFKRGVLSHVWFPSQAERGLRRRRAPRAGRSRRRQSPTMLLALLDSLQRLVDRLSYGSARSDWAQYAETHSYSEDDFARKKGFIARHAAAQCPGLTWDLGANTGTYSRIAAQHSRLVVAVDADQDAVEMLYHAARDGGQRNILPLVMDMANLSPDQGWAGRERAAFDRRASPDLVLCLALVHHLRVAANIPLPLFFAWLRGLDAPVLIEFVGRNDEMFRQLTENKQEEYADYTAANFEAEVNRAFAIRDRLALKGGKREMFLLEPV